MEYVIYGVAAVLVSCLGVVLTIFDLPGNTLMVLATLALAVLTQPVLDMPYLGMVLLVYLLGELWEAGMSFFGIKKEKVSWTTVFVIGLGGFAGTAVGTGFFPILGSFIGGCIGAFLAAFGFTYLKNGNQRDALHLAWQAAKVRCLAMLGKMTAGFVLAFFLVKLAFSR